MNVAQEMRLLSTLLATQTGEDYDDFHRPPSGDGVSNALGVYGELGQVLQQAVRDFLHTKDADNHANSEETGAQEAEASSEERKRVRTVTFDEGSSSATKASDAAASVERADTCGGVASASFVGRGDGRCCESWQEDGSRWSGEFAAGYAGYGGYHPGINGEDLEWLAYQYDFAARLGFQVLYMHWTQQRSFFSPWLPMAEQHQELPTVPDFGAALGTQPSVGASEQDSSRTRHVAPVLASAEDPDREAGIADDAEYADIVEQEFTVRLSQQRLLAELEDPSRFRLFCIDLESCVLSCYHDRIEPFLGEVQHRMQERRDWSRREAKAAIAVAARRSDKYRLLPPRVAVQPLVLLRDEPSWFQGWVQGDGPDRYHGSVWEGVQEAFADARNSGGAALPGQVALAAKELRARNPQYLEKLCLGELRNIVNLALSDRRLLVYEGCTLRCVNEASSTSEDCDAVKSKQRSRKASANMIADLEKLAKVLERVIAKAPEQSLQLSKLREALRQNGRLELPDDLWGCAQISHLFRLHPLADRFQLQHGRVDSVLSISRRSLVERAAAQVPHRPRTPSAYRRKVQHWQ